MMWLDRAAADPKGSDGTVFGVAVGWLLGGHCAMTEFPLRGYNARLYFPFTNSIAWDHKRTT